MKRESQEHRISRRHVLTGAVSVAAIGVLPSSSALAAPGEIEQLGQQLERLTWRCSRLHRRVRELSGVAGQLCAEGGVEAFLPDGRHNPMFDAVRRSVGYTDTWRVWSAAVSESLELAERIRRTDAVRIDDLSTKYDALLWVHFHHDMALSIDPIQLRHLRAFGRELRRHSERLG